MAFFPVFSKKKTEDRVTEQNQKKYFNSEASCSEGLTSGEKSTLKDNSKKKNSFVYHHTVSIGDTNITRSVYFTRYLEWLGYAREAMLIDTVDPSEIVSGEIVLVTKNTAIAYLKEFDLYDKVELHVTTGKLTPSTVQLCFRYIHAQTQELYAVAKQLIELLRNKKILQKKKTKISNIQYCHSESRALYY